MDIRPISEHDMAIRSLPQGDDVDARLPKVQLDLEHLEAEGKEWVERLGHVDSLMRAYLQKGQGQINSLLRKCLDRDANLQDVDEAMRMSGGIGVAQDILKRVNAAHSAIESYLERRRSELEHGQAPANLRGRIRTMREELKRYEVDGQAAEQMLARGAEHLVPELAERLRNEVSVYRRKARDLAALEAQLVFRKGYELVSESDYFRSVILSALVGGSHAQR
jgi:exonuclease VII large subunit